MFTVSKTYAVVTKESAERGDYSDTGYELEPHKENLKNTLKLIESLGFSEASNHRNHIDFYGVNEELQGDECVTYHVRVQGSAKRMARLNKILDQRK